MCGDDQQWTTTAQRVYTYDLTDNPTDRAALIGLNNRLNGYDGWTLVYDNEGNLTGKSKTGQPTYVYGWNALGQLTSVTVNGTLAATYAYDGLGRRVYRGGSAGAQWYVHSGDNLLLAVSSAGAVTDEYTYFPGIDQPLGVRRGTAQYYFATDANGNVLALTDSAGAVKNQYRYSPFGVAELVSETVDNPLRYAAREWDPDATLYFNRARWYDPQLQRFTSQDPIGIEGGLNLYAYAGNDPVNASDPWGLFGCRYTGHRWDRLTEAYTDGWTCDGWGMPAWLMAEIMTLRRASARACEGWRCPGLLQDNSPAPGSSCEKLGCILREPYPHERARVERVLNSLRRNDAFCQLVRTHGLAAAARDLRFFDNPVLFIGDNGIRQQLFGNAPSDIRRGGLPVMYLYGRPGKLYDHDIVHEAVHTVPMRSNPFQGYPDHDGRSIYNTPHGDIDATASYCMRRG